MSKVEVNQVTQQCGTTLTVGGGACKTAVVDATTVTLGRCGGTVSLASGATQSGFGRTGTVDWITTPKVTGDSPITAVTGKGYFLNTTAGTITVNLPAGAAGSIVSLADYANTWATNNVTVAPNGSEKIGGITEDARLSTEGQSVTLVYVDGTQGWINTMDSTSNVRGVPPFPIATGGTPACGTICGNYKIHTFTGPGTFCVSQVAPGPSGNPNVADYVVVAGGASGGVRNPGNSNGGGGAGGFRFRADPSNNPIPGAPALPLNAPAGITLATSAYSICVGGGGASIAGPIPTGQKGNPGSTSTFSTISSTGGGGGGGGYSAKEAGISGGSGGGSAGGVPAGTTGGAGNTPPVSPAQGTAGGPGGATSPDSGSGGGGGAICAGKGSTCQTANGPGGDGAGLPTAFGSNGVPCGSYRYYAGGGGGGDNSCHPSPCTASKGGGGSSSTAGTLNSGGGGGGGSTLDNVGSGTGGSGIVIIRYKFQ